MTKAKKLAQILFQVRVVMRTKDAQGDPAQRRMTLPVESGKPNGLYSAALGKLSGWGIAHMGMFDQYLNVAYIQVVNRKSLTRDQLDFVDQLLGDLDEHDETVNLKKKLTTKCRYRYDPYTLTVRLELHDFVPILNFS